MSACDNTHLCMNFTCLYCLYCLYCSCCIVCIVCIVHVVLFALFTTSMTYFFVSYTFEGDYSDTIPHCANDVSAGRCGDGVDRLLSAPIEWLLLQTLIHIFV